MLPFSLISHPCLNCAILFIIFFYFHISSSSQSEDNFKVVNTQTVPQRLKLVVVIRMKKAFVYLVCPPPKLHLRLIRHSYYNCCCLLFRTFSLHCIPLLFTRKHLSLKLCNILPFSAYKDGDKLISFITFQQVHV